MTGSLARVAQSRRAADVVAKLFGHDEPHAFGGSATAGVFSILRQIVTVVVGQLFAGRDVSVGDDPKMAIIALDEAVGVAMMIDEAGGVPLDTSIDVGVVIENKNEGIALNAAVVRLYLGDFLADILDDFLAAENFAPGECSKAMND